MATCNACVHYKACENIFQIFTGDTKPYRFTGACKFYKSTADVVEIRHGSWKSIWVDTGHIDMERMYKCTKCGGRVWNDTYNYCPHCGAKMD